MTAQATPTTEPKTTTMPPTRHSTQPPSPAAPPSDPPPAQRQTTIRPGDRILALEPDTGARYLLLANGKGARKEKGLGVVDPDRLVGQAYGTLLALGAKQVVLLRPSMADLASTIARKAQIILPKDAARILFELGIGPGHRVLESGIGSAGLTIPLLAAVGTAGEVVAQELREDFADWARANVEKAGLAARLSVHIGDMTQGVAPGIAGPFDACVLDQPEPWLALPHVAPLLAPGASVACYTPQVSQMEEASRTMTRLGFVDVRQMETIERLWEVKERGSRPSFDGLGHTGFLVFGRYVGPAAQNRPHSAS